MSDQELNPPLQGVLKSCNSSDLSKEERKRKRESLGKSSPGINIITNSNVHENNSQIIQRDLPDADNISIMPDETESNDGSLMDGDNKSLADANENSPGLNGSQP